MKNETKALEQIIIQSGGQIEFDSIRGWYVIWEDGVTQSYLNYNDMLFWVVLGYIRNLKRDLKQVQSERDNCYERYHKV